MSFFNILCGCSENVHSKNETINFIQPRSGWQFVDFKEIIEYRDLFYFMVWRQIKVAYAQTILGFSWAILQPLLQIVIFTIIFGKVARVNTDGIPYFLFSSVAIIPWTYMSQSMSESSQSLVLGQHMLGKIYFPRLVLPLTPILSRLVDFGISIVIILGVLIFYRVQLTWNLLFLPFFVFIMVCVPTAIGVWSSALAIRFRDIRHATPFVIRMLMYSAPIVYSASSIPERYRIIYSVNPIVGVVEGFRACLLGTPIPWLYIWPGAIAGCFLFLISVLYFQRMERVFADVI